jgi:23S rRNA (adenine2503-C2)-methyltransferase
LGVTLDLSRAPAKPVAPPNLTGLSRPELAAALVDAGVVPEGKAKMRASQLWRWIHHYGVTDFAQMTDVAKETRAALWPTFSLARPQIVERQVSKDGTRKWLIRMASRHRGRDRLHSRRGPGRRALRELAGRLHAQLHLLPHRHPGPGAQPDRRRDRGPGPGRPRRPGGMAFAQGRPPLSNIVFMGMGEPLYNLDNVADAIDIISDNEGIAIVAAADHVSTSGVVPQLQALGEKTRAGWPSRCTPPTTSCATCWCR